MDFGEIETFSGMNHSPEKTCRSERMESNGQVLR